MAQFRQQLYQNFNKRADTTMELVDAISSYGEARSVVELSLAPCFRRGHDALYQAVSAYEWGPNGLAQLAAPYLKPPEKRPFWLLGVDVTPQPRPYAKTVEDRGMVYQPNMVKGNKPVTIGHQYSTVGLLPEAEAGMSPSWLVPLRTERVKSSQDTEMVGSEQVEELLTDAKLPWYRALVVEVVDTKYSKRPYLCANRGHENLVMVCRVANNRVFYRQAQLPVGKKPVGHPKWYGEAFRLAEAATWGEADATVCTEHRSRGGRHYQVQIQAWYNLLMRGKQKPIALPMHQYPFTLLRLELLDPKTQQPIFQRPLWLLVMGSRRHELSSLDLYHAYKQRYDLEHFFRFGKQKLLLASYQTPDSHHEEAWWQLVHLAYLQLWLARHLADSLPRPWERHLPATKAKLISPTLVQRDFNRIIRQLGTPARPPKRRGYSSGWLKGRPRTPRTRHKVIVKGQPKESSP
ncbi:MAG: NF041680 family putative transposase [Chloroflexota bacterium]